MGYTQYFSKKELTHPKKKWDAFLTDVKKVANTFNLCKLQSVDFIQDGICGNKDSDIKIGDGSGEGDTPEFTASYICFNGVGENAHETLRIERDSSHILKSDERMDKFYRDNWENEGRYSDFTKTNHKPYDTLVTATLALYKYHFGDKVTVSGDGGPDGFQAGLDLVNETLGTSIKMDDVYPTG